MPFIHHLSKRKAEADSQYIYKSGVHANGYVLPKSYITVASPVVYNRVLNRACQSYNEFHSIGKGEAEADSQFINNAGLYAYGYNGYFVLKVFNGVYNTVASQVVSYNGFRNGLYNTYSEAHSIGKREAEANCQWVYNQGTHH